MTELPGKTSNTSLEVIERLQATIVSVLRDYQTDQPYALLDFPDHANVGDSAIWAGEMAYFRKHWKRDPSFVARYDTDLSGLDRAVPNGPIFIHGGGNFGDIWPVNQDFRESILNRYPGRTVIQLPQSIHFSDPAAIARTAEVIARHRAFVLLVRDQESYDLATKHFDCTIRLCPDMAFCIGPITKPAPPSHELLVLLRTDKETVAADRSILDGLKDTVVDDWLIEPRFRHLKAKLLSVGGALASFNPSQLGEEALRVRYYDELVEDRMRRGIALLAQGRQIICDRLHAHIISTLLDIPQVLLDNNYGKITRFVGAWGSDWSRVKRASTLSDAVDLVKNAA